MHKQNPLKTRNAGIAAQLIYKQLIKSIMAAVSRMGFWKTLCLSFPLFLFMPDIFLLKRCKSVHIGGDISGAANNIATWLCR